MKVSCIIIFTALLVASALWESTEAKRPAERKPAAKKPAAKKAVDPMHVHKDHVHCKLDNEELEVGQERYLMANGKELGCSKVVCHSDGLVAKFLC